MKRHILIILAGIIIVIVIIPLLFLVGLHLFSADIEEINDQDLIPIVELPPENKNAYFLLVEAGENATSDDYNTHEIIAFLKGEAVEVHKGIYPDTELVQDFGDNEIEDLLEKNKDALNLLEKISNTNSYQDPVFEDLDSLSYKTELLGMPPLNVPGLARIYSIKILYEFKKGNTEDALNMCLDLIKMGQLIQDSHDTIVKYLIGGSVKSIGYQTMAYLIYKGDLSDSQVKLYSKKLEDYKDSLNGLKNSYKIEYIFARNTVDLIAEEKPESFINAVLWNHAFYFKPNKTKKLLAENTRQLIQIQKPELISVFNPNDTLYLLTHENSIGEAVFMSIYTEDMSSSMFKLDFAYRALQTLIALKLYENESDELPETLEELVPKYLNEVPLDPFDGEQLRYDLNKGIIYSVDENLMDDGGDDEADFVIKFKL